MGDFTARTLFETGTLSVRDVCCAGTCRHLTAEEAASRTQLVFAYRGVFVRHLGRDEAVAEANQVLLFNAHEGYRVGHPVAGGDACLTVTVAEPLLREIAPPSVMQEGTTPRFVRQRQRIDARAQALLAILRHGLVRGIAEPLEAESLALTLVQRALGPRTAHAARGSAARRRLVDRAKVVLAGDLARRWTLADIAAEVGGSPVHLTRVFQEVEGMPLYRYQMRLRLACALDRLPDCEDLTQLGLDLGFSSHSHFTAAFRETFGRTPSDLRAAAIRPASRSRSR